MFRDRNYGHPGCLQLYLRAKQASGSADGPFTRPRPTVDGVILPALAH